MASQYLIDAVQGYENYILSNGIDEDVIFAMIEAAKTAILTEKDEKYGLEVSKRAKELVNEYVFLRFPSTSVNCKRINSTSSSSIISKISCFVRIIFPFLICLIR